MSIYEFARADARKYERELLKRRFESLCKTVAEREDITLSLSSGGSCTDGKHVQLSDPFTFYDQGFTADESISLALHCTIHEAGHILHTRDISGVLTRANEKYAKEGYKWSKLYGLIDLLEDFRADRANEKVRPGIVRYRQQAARLLLPKLREVTHVSPIEIEIMAKYFAEVEYSIAPHLAEKFEIACDIFDDCAKDAKDFADVPEYAVRMYNLLYKVEEEEKKEPPKPKEKTPPSKKEDSDDTPPDMGDDEEYGESDEFDEWPPEAGDDESTEEGDAKDEDSTDDLDDLLDDTDEPSPDDEEGEKHAYEDDSEDEYESEPYVDDSEEEEEKPDADSLTSLSKTSALFDMAKVEEDLDLSPEPDEEAPLVGESNVFKGRIQLYPTVDHLKNPELVYAMAREGIHANTEVTYVFFPDKTTAGKRTYGTYEVLKSKKVQAEIRTFITRAKNYLNMNNQGEVHGKMSGKLNVNKLWRAASDIRDSRVFSKNLEESKGDTAIYLLCDASGSMCSIVDVTRRAVYMLASMCVAYNIPCKVVSFDASPTDLHRRSVRHVEHKNWMDTNLDAIACYDNRSDNRDGMSIHLATLELAQRPESNKLLFVLSDGAPGDVTSSKDKYYDAYGIDDTAHYVRKARGTGIQVLGVYMTRDTSRADEHKKMYGDELYVVSEIEQIPSLLLRAISRFTRK